MQLTTPEIIGLAVVAIEGILSLLSAVLPKASEEESIVNNILNLIHGVGFNSDKIVKPANKKAQESVNSLVTFADEGLKIIKSLADSVNNNMPNTAYYKPFTMGETNESEPETKEEVKEPDAKVEPIKPTGVAPTVPPVANK